MITSKLAKVLARRPLGLVFDIDGTLSPIAPTPREARLYPGTRELLERARDRPDVRVAIVTGRTVENGAAMVNVEGITYIGNHGLEWSDGLPATAPVQVEPEARAYTEPGKQLLDLAEQKLAWLTGIIIERKRVGGAIHYRLCRNPEEAHRQILTLLTEPARELGMRLSEGKRVVEVRAPIAIDKGRALRKFVQRKGLQGVVFAGDDRTDLDAVMEVARLRDEGTDAFSIVVKHADTIPALIENADEVVEEVVGMVELLGEMVATL